MTLVTIYDYDDNAIADNGDYTRDIDIGDNYYTGDNDNDDHTGDNDDISDNDDYNDGISDNGRAQYQRLSACPRQVVTSVGQFIILDTCPTGQVHAVLTC